MSDGDDDKLQGIAQATVILVVSVPLFMVCLGAIMAISTGNANWLWLLGFMLFYAGL